MRTLRHRQRIKNNSMLALGFLVFLGVVLTTLAQAEEAPLAAQPDTSWLLPKAVYVSGGNGLYRMQVRGTVGDDGWSAESDASSGVDMSLGLGFQGERTGNIDTPARDFHGLYTGLHPVTLNGPQLFMTIGHRW